MRIALFGGTFDPPHRGHLAVAQAAAAACHLDEVLFAPTGRQPLKSAAATASFADRLAMVSLLCATNAGSTRFTPSTCDAPQEGNQPNFTVDTLRRLRAEPAQRSIDWFVLCGADAFLDLRRWREPDDLLKLAEWIVVSRPGFSLADLSALHLTREQQSRVHLLEGVQENVSATEVRECLESRADCSPLLTPSVLKYIHEHRLYLSLGPTKSGQLA